MFLRLNFIPFILFVIIPFSPSIFILYYIIKSLKNKVLSKKGPIGWTIYMCIEIVLCLIPYVDYIRGNPYDDISGIIFIFIIIIELINLFVLWLFYSIYYIEVNKDMDFKVRRKPLDKFIQIISLLICIIFIWQVTDYIKDNKEYFTAPSKNIKIYKVDNYYDMKKLKGYKELEKDIKVSDIMKEKEKYIGKKVLIKGKPIKRNINLLKKSLKWEFITDYENRIDVYFKNDELSKSFNDKYTYVYGSIKSYTTEDSDDFYGDVLIISPEVIYYVNESNDNYYFNYEGNWVADNINVNIDTKNFYGINITINNNIRSVNLDEKNIYLLNKNIVFEDYYNNIKGIIELNKDNLELDILESDNDIRPGIYMLKNSKDIKIENNYIFKFAGNKTEDTYYTYIYKIDNGKQNYGFKYINTKIENNLEEIILIGELGWTDEVFDLALNNNAYDYVLIPNDDTMYSIEEFKNIFLKN